MQIEIEIEKLSKQIGPKELLFSDLSFRVENGDIVSIVGPNGSGKSTFLKILAGVLKPSKGSIIVKFENQLIQTNEFHRFFGYVAPYLNLYEEFHPLEHIKVISKIRNIEYNERNSLDLLDRFDLLRHRYKPVKLFSSGMKQRMRVILSIINNPPVMLLDEPFSNLDDKGIELYRQIIAESNSKDSIIFIASNDEREISISNKQINLREYK